MTQEEKDLLLKDLCARLPYGAVLKVRLIDNYDDMVERNIKLTQFNIGYAMSDSHWLDFKVYLRPMSSITEEEKEELLAKLPTKWNIEIDKFGDFYFDICEECAPDIELFTDIIDWLNKNMFDFRGLIPKGHAIEAPKEMYKKGE